MPNNFYHLPITDTLKTAWSKVSGSKKYFLITIALFFSIYTALFILKKHLGITSNLIPVGPNIGIKSNELGVQIGNGEMIGFNAPHLGLILAIQFISFIVCYVASCGLLFLGIQRANDKKLSYLAFFRGFKPNILIKLVGLSFILTSLMFLIMTAGFLLSYAVPFLSIYIIALTVVMVFYLILRIFFAKAFIIDKNIGPFAALSLSFQLTRKNVLRVAGIFITAILIYIVGALFLGIGLIWSIPCSYIILGETYKTLQANVSAQPMTCSSNL